MHTGFWVLIAKLIPTAYFDRVMDIISYLMRISWVEARFLKTFSYLTNPASNNAFILRLKWFHGQKMNNHQFPHDNGCSFSMLHSLHA